MYETRIATRFRKVGNSYAVIIPKKVFADINSERVVLSYKNKKITIKGEMKRNEKHTNPGNGNDSEK